MINPLKFRLINQLQHYKQGQTTKGFTLIELLVAIILAALVITPLLGFMINILSTDRQEQAKATSEQDIRSAIDYIAQDLEQAVYIYNQDGLSAIGIQDQLPPSVATGVNGCDNSGSGSCEPILVFWKREIKPDVIPINNCTGTDCFNDAYVYSLVGYYLISGNNPNDTWSDVARIARLEVSGGVLDPDDSTPNNPSDDYLQEPDAGFAPFSLTGSGSLEEKMNKWQNAANNDDYNNPNDENFNITFNQKVLVDYIDNTELDITTNPPAVPSAMICTADEQRLPNTDEPKGFYACVDSQENSARVYIRGNALARLQTNNVGYDSSKSTYFPTATIQVEGRGSLYTKQ